MKRIEVYTRDYELAKTKNPFDCDSTDFLRNPKDTIAEQLVQYCIPQFDTVNIQRSIVPLPLDSLNFL